MEQQALNDTLNNLIGHLVLDSPRAQEDFENLANSLSKSALEDGDKMVTARQPIFEKSDLFFENRISEKRGRAIDSIAYKRTAKDSDPQFRVFRREVPLREHLLQNSVAEWAVGAKVDHSVGPFTSKDGRQFWYDFFPIVKLVALYIDGEAQPALLFKIRENGQIFVGPNLPIAANPSKTYNLIQGSIWVNSKYLAPNAPANTFVGLAITGGRVTLEEQPQMVNEKLTIGTNKKITVNLELDQPEVTDAISDSTYGDDARQMQLQLPQTLRFHFSSNGRSIDEVGNASWELYGQALGFEWNANGQTTFDNQLQRIVFPFNASEQTIIIQNNASSFHFLSQNAQIDRSGWVLPVATIDIVQPLAAAGIGAMMVQGDHGILNRWTGLEGGNLSLNAPIFIVGPGQISLTDLSTANSHASQSLHLWKDEINPLGTKVNLSFADTSTFFYISNANGNELLLTSANADFQIDRPVKVDGYAPTVRSLNSLLVIGVSEAFRLVYLLDYDLIADDSQLDNEDPIIPERMAFALTNALFKVTEPNSCLLFGTLSEDFTKVEKGFLFLGFGLLDYIPTLPDPYAARLARCPDEQRVDRATGAIVTSQDIKGLLVSLVTWDLPTDDSQNDEVEVSFHFAPTDNRFLCRSLDEPVRPDRPTPVPASTGGGNLAENPNTFNELNSPISRLAAIDRTAPVSTVRSSGFSTGNSDGNTLFATTGSTKDSSVPIPLPDFEILWEDRTYRYERDIFALLDVSTNADLFGISFDLLNRRRFGVRTGEDGSGGESTSSFYPIQVEGMDVISTGANVKAFTVPQISWEPVFNLTPPPPPPPPPEVPIDGDPEAGFNYYPNDGGPTRILNNSDQQIKLAPLSLTEFLVQQRQENEDFNAYSFFTLPFGMRAVALLAANYTYQNSNRDGGDLAHDKISFENDMHSGLQLRMDGGQPLREGDSDMFMGSTVQVNNILNLNGQPTGNSTLGGSVTTIFNKEFFQDPNYAFELFKQRGVPVTRMDLSGYGASMFSNWLNTKAAIAETSQAKFDVFVGRCGHEIIQVKSIMYPWAIKVVRTITLFRVSSGYVYRFDTGWRAESEGKFDFRYYAFIANPEFPGTDPENPEPQLIGDERSAEYQIHPGLINGLYNISNIVETGEIEPFNTTVEFSEYLDAEGKDALGPKDIEVDLQPVYFDADIAVDGVSSGAVTKPTSEGEKELVPSKRIVGFVQLGPKGFPLNNGALQLLVLRQGNIGGAIDCEVNLAGSNQKMRLSRFDFNNSFNEDGVSPVFSVAGRGNVLLPKEGSWSMVQHERSTGDVTPVPANLSIPVIRKGKLILDEDTSMLVLDPPVSDVLTRLAEPTELLRQPTSTTINYGFLQSTDTQKALILTPSFKLDTKRLMSKTPPLFVDAFRIVNTKSIFPNIGEAANFAGDTVGEAILMKKGGSVPFNTSDLQDLGADVYELMDIQDTINNVAQQGLQMLHNPEEAFDLPTEFTLIDLGDNFRIYIEYDKKDKNGNVEEAGGLDFDINSVAESWKSKMNNIGLVIDLAGISRLMTIRGNWDSGNGKEATYPQPDLEFSPELQPLIDLLEILQSLQEGNYGEAVQNGLKLAMSNKAGSWEYKFEASKEIPVLRFPVPDAVYNDPNTPFKLEAGLNIGAYFNAALKVTTDADELLPSAGGVLGFYARLSVMCVSISAATVYAIGQANVDITADTKLGPALLMKFGFGAQIVVGLPVAGNVSVLFVVGAEIVISDKLVKVSAFLIFEGHAEILGGIVSITIRIEAKGTYSKKMIGSGSRTDLQCQVTFGLDISIAFIINLSFSESWSEQRRIA